MTVRKLSFLLLILSLQTTGQSWKFISRVDLGQEVTAADVGTLGKVYLGTERGNIFSLLSDGSNDSEYSSSIFQPVTSLDASNSLRVFVFYKDVSQFEFLERFSAFPRRYHLTDFGLDRADGATLGSNNTIWLLDGTELTQVNPIDHSILFRYSLDGGGLDAMGRDRVKIEQMILTTSEIPLKTAGFENQEKFVPELTYLKVENEDGTTNRLEWPQSNISFVLFSQNFFHLVSGEIVMTYQLAE